jgi:CheY-like chemotaxis protein
VGVGTAISFTLPRHDNVVPVATRRPVRLGGEVASERPGLAVIDPPGETAWLLSRYLDGYSVRRLASPGQIDRRFRRHPPAVVVVTTADAQRAWHSHQRTHPELARTATLRCDLRTRETIAAGLGVTAYLVKPVSQAQLTRALRRLRRPLRRLLVVDDDGDMRALLLRMLGSSFPSCQVVEAGDGATGVTLARELRPDAVVLDLLMPGVDGYALLRGMQEDEWLRDVPVVVISARGESEGLVSSMIEIGRPGGLSVGETVACVRGSLEGLLSARREGVGGPAAFGTAPGPRAGCPD